MLNNMENETSYSSHKWAKEMHGGQKEPPNTA